MLLSDLLFSPEYQYFDLDMLQRSLELDSALFTSVDISFEHSYQYLFDFNEHLKQYNIAVNNIYSFCDNNTHVIPTIELSDNFYLFLLLAIKKNSDIAKKTCDLLQLEKNHPLFFMPKIEHDNNIYYHDIYNVYLASEKLLSHNILFDDFMHMIDCYKSTLFHQYDLFLPTINTEIKQINDDTFLSFINEDCIVQLKEKIYINLLIDFIEEPEKYHYARYFFMDFFAHFSFNSHCPFLHLKKIFLRFEDKHWKIIKTLKEHSLYYMILNTLFVESPSLTYESDNLSQQYNYYFDFQSFIFLLNKHVYIEDLFDCHATENQNMKDFLSAIVNYNDYEPDNQRFKKIMILYDKYKLEKKLITKNIPSIVQKI